MLLKNVRGTSNATCKCGTWFKHWEKYSGQAATLCSERTCTGKDLVGAHVQKASSTDTTVYIVPLCTKHNQDTGTIDVVDYRALVPENNPNCKS